MGKSVIAMQYAKDCVDLKTVRDVYLLNCASEKFTTEVINLAFEMGLRVDESGNVQQLDHIFKKIHARIEQCSRKGDTLLIFDNAEELFLLKYLNHLIGQRHFLQNGLHPMSMNSCHHRLNY